MVVAGGLTETLEPVCVPTPLSTETETALATDQASVELFPAVIVAGVAVTPDSVGAATTVTVTCAVVVAPREFAAVSV